MKFCQQCFNNYNLLQTCILEEGVGNYLGALCSQSAIWDFTVSQGQCQSVGGACHDTATPISKMWVIHRVYNLNV